jgi:hypothetical protein
MKDRVTGQFRILYNGEVSDLSRYCFDTNSGQNLVPVNAVHYNKLTRFKACLQYRRMPKFLCYILLCI